ncbi:Fungalysin metallopeptidase-domain-containing protein [Mucidula mucida]|nr:Fungalysin metallopeptidase-domain-containing protein [Mucidula mucida]
MVAFNNVLSSHTTHRVRHISRQLKLNTYHPRSTFKSFGTGIDHPLSKRADATLGEMTTTFLASQLGVDVQKVAYRAGFTGEVSSHAYLRQSHDGVPFANAVANVAMQNNKVVSYGSSFVTCSSIASSTPSVAVEDAITMAENMLGGTYNKWNSTLEYLVKEDNTAALTHVVQIQNQDTGAWYEAFVDAHSGELLSVTDFVAKASYLVVPFEDETLDEGGQVLLKDPENLKASPLGWHSDGQNEFTTTQGNNAFAFKGRRLSAQSAAGQTFNFPVDLTTEPNVGANVDAARTNAFFVVNSVHDVTYLYDAFNFQSNNFGNGGRGNDPVSISVQDAAGVDNADFSTPGDGQSGQMRMFLWDFTSPGRDGALENDVIVHENTHGVTNRMTGGGTGRCLQTLEAGGMGEGCWVANSAAIEDFAVGQFVFDNPAGLRSFPYSTDATVNPLRYSDLQHASIVPQCYTDIGEVWANIMHNVLAALVADLGFSETAKTDPTGTEGNVVFLHLMLDALQLQPCNPDFISARDAWYQADEIRFNGANTCTLQVAFASRGLGLNAKNHVDDATVDRACR